MKTTLVHCPRWLLLRRWNSQYVVCSYWTIARVWGAAEVSRVAKLRVCDLGAAVVVTKDPKLDMFFLIFWTGVHLMVCCAFDIVGGVSNWFGTGAFERVRIRQGSF